MFKNWNLWEKTWLFTFIAIAIGLSILWGETWFGFSVFLTGVICVVLVAKGGIWNYAWGVYNVIGYAYISYNNGYFGEVMLNAGFFLPMQFIGWYMWHKHLENKEVIMKKLSTRNTFIVLAISTFLVYVYGFSLSLIKGQNVPYLDSMSTIFSIVATFLMIYRFREQWILWIIVNIASIALWALRINSGVDGAGPMIAMWSAYLINAIYGYYKWNKNSKEITNV